MTIDNIVLKEKKLDLARQLFIEAVRDGLDHLVPYLNWNYRNASDDYHKAKFPQRYRHTEGICYGNGEGI